MKKSTRLTWNLIATALLIVAALAFVVHKHCSKNTCNSQPAAGVSTGEYFLFDDPEWVANCNGTAYYVVGTDRESDVQLRRNGYIDVEGYLTILKADAPRADAPLKPILNAREIVDNYNGMGSTNDIYIRILPSADDPDVLDFEFHFNGEDAPEHRGTVNTATRTFKIF